MTPDRWQVVKSVLADALALDPAARSDWLNKRCGDDQTLRAEVDSLLDHAGTEDFLESPLLASGLPPTSTPENAATGRNRLGERYRLIRTIGAGGMGTVYEATDDKLGRRVAIKILPAEFAASDERHRRFSRETRIIAGLSHPSLCQVYDAGIHEGRPFLVMELVDGETLASRLERGPLPEADVVACASQVAEALAYAHQAGVVHRDLKPANIMLTPAGVKLLDFGLAKILRDSETGTTGAPDSTTPTADDAVTGSGAILGTLHYMAPEQLEGRGADARSDVFSLGVVIFEMLTGERPFVGASQASIVAAILRDPPPRASARQPLVHDGFDPVILACLEKDPDTRWQSARDVGTAVRAVARDQTSGTPPARRRPASPWTLAATAVAGAGLALWLAPAGLFPLPVGAGPTTHLAIVAPPDLEGHYFGPSLSPDGRHIAFVSVRAGEQPRVWLRSMDSPTPRALPGTEGALRLFWSPDSRQIAFFAQGGWRRIAVFGGSSELVCEAATGVWGGSWSKDGVIMFSGGPGDGLYRISPGSPLPERLTQPDSSTHEDAHLWPVFLPDGRTFLYTVASARPDTQGIYVASLDAPHGRRLNDAWSATAYAPEGYVVYARDQLLVAQRFDTERLTFTGDPQVVGARATSARWGYFSVARGVLGYLSAEQRAQMVWLDRGGRELGLLGREGAIGGPALSPSGRHAALHIADTASGNDDIWVFDLSNGNGARVTRTAASDSDVVWSPDGSEVAYARDGMAFYRSSIAHDDTDRLLFRSSGGEVYPNDWSSDGKWLVYSDFSNSWADLWLLPVPAATRPVPLRRTPFGEHQARFSPDSKWIAYTSEESGRPEVYVQAVPPDSKRVLVSALGGTQPMWRGDGRELYYLADDHAITAVPFAVKDGTPTVGRSQVLFYAPQNGGNFVGVRNHYAVTGDGQQFLVRRPLRGGSWEFAVIFNWTGTLGGSTDPVSSR